MRHGSLLKISLRITINQIDITLVHYKMFLTFIHILFGFKNLNPLFICIQILGLMISSITYNNYNLSKLVVE